MVLLALACAAVLISTAALAVVIADVVRARLIVYGVCLIASLALLSIALLSLLGLSDRPSAATLPLGLPCLGAHFRLDALSAFFLAVVNLGAAAASLFALGYGRHEHAPRRVLPFYPAFLAGMSIVVLADDAFTFLVSWEFMSLSSWALVMAHHHDNENRHAGYVYIVMASFGTRSDCSRRGAAAIHLPRCAAVRMRSPGWSWSWSSSAPARRPVWCRCTS